MHGTRKLACMILRILDFREKLVISHKLCGNLQKKLALEWLRIGRIVLMLWLTIRHKEITWENLGKMSHLIELCKCLFKSTYN